MAELQGKGSITETNNLFIFPSGEELGKNDIKNFVEYHNSNLKPDFNTSRNYYIGKHPILDKDPKPMGKPDNRLVVNYPRYIVDTFNGFSYGIPPKITIDGTSNDALQNFNSSVSLMDKIYELAKLVSIYGQAYLLAYQDENKATQAAVISPERGFIIRDDTVAQRPIAFVMYSYTKDNKLLGSVYTDSGIYDLEMNQVLVNPYKLIPAVEFFENDERQGTFENVETLVDAVNQVLSQKANNVDYFADAYLKVLGAEIDEETMDDIADNRLINISGDAGRDAIVEFLQKPDGDVTEENLVNRLNNLIFQISSVANITDDTFGTADSGKALEYHLLSMRNLAANKDRKFTQSLRAFYKIVFTVLSGIEPDDWRHLSFKFNRNLPSNLSDEASVAKQLEGVVSKETQLKVLSVVDDPKTEIEKMNEEAKEQADVANTSSTLYDFEKNGDKPDDER